MDRKSFTLIEVAAAIVVLAVLVLPLLGARNAVIASATETSRKLIAVQLAASKMSEVISRSMDEIERSGSFEYAPECTWNFSITKESADEEKAEWREEGWEEELKARSMPLYRVVLVVSYPSPKKGRGELTVSTLVFKQERRSPESED